MVIGETTCVWRRPSEGPAPGVQSFGSFLRLERIMDLVQNNIQRLINPTKIISNSVDSPSIN